MILWVWEAFSQPSNLYARSRLGPKIEIFAQKSMLSERVGEFALV